MFSLRSNSLKPYESPYKSKVQNFDVRHYFDGKIKAWGLVQNWRGQVQTRFDMAMTGTWDGDRGRLVEEFTYYTGRTDRREWMLTVTGDGQLTGVAADVKGEAKGGQQGCALYWAYYLRLPVNGRVYLVHLDDWMFQMNDNVLINRSYIKKFGFKVAEMTVCMQKLSGYEPA